MLPPLIVNLDSFVSILSCNRNQKEENEYHSNKNKDSHHIYSSVSCSLVLKQEIWFYSRHNDSRLAKPRVSYNTAQRGFNIHRMHRGMRSLCFGQILRLNRMFLLVGKSLWVRWNLRSIIEYILCKKLWEDIWNGAVFRCGCGVRSSGAGAGAVHVREKSFPHTGVWVFIQLSEDP